MRQGIVMEEMMAFDRDGGEYNMRKVHDLALAIQAVASPSSAAFVMATQTMEAIHNQDARMAMHHITDACHFLGEGESYNEYQPK